MGKTGKQSGLSDTNGKKWLLIFYTVPSKPVNARMRIWRKLAKAGAVQFKSAIYILPNNEDNYELCQWIVSEAASMNGEGAFVSVERIETIDDRKIIDLFNRQRERDYLAIEKGLVEIENKMSAVRKGTRLQQDKKLREQLNRRLKEFNDVRKTDFFASKSGTALKKRLDSIQAEIIHLSKTVFRASPEITTRNTEEYLGRTWGTRKRPFVDRMASAWLIRKFIDKEAEFIFIDEKEAAGLKKGNVTFDIRDGEFTHAGDMCTFEVLVRSFNLKDKKLKRIAEIVHELDIKDERYSVPEAKGIEDILKGIRIAAGGDMEMLEKGMEVFEMLYASKVS